MSVDSRLRVLFVIGSMGGGGAERQVLEILWRLDRTRFVPHLYLAMKQGELMSEVPADVPVSAYWDRQPESISRRLLRMLKLTRLLRYLHLARVLRDQKIDLIYDRTYLATLDAAGACWFRPTPRISCCVADPQPELEQHARFSVRMAWLLARRAYQSASVVLANSEGLRRRMLDYFHLHPEHVKVYQNLLANVRPPSRADAGGQVDALHGPGGAGTDEAAASVPKESAGEVSPERDERWQTLRAIFREDNPSFLIVSAGRLHPQKGYQYLLEAMHEVVNHGGRDVQLVIFGQGESRRELTTYIEKHGLERHVYLAGFDRDPRRWYRHAKLFVLPSLSDAMPNALIEAVIDGVPALATTCPTGPKEILADGELGGLVPPEDARALADAIVDAMDHHEQWRARAVRAKEIIEKTFDPESGMHRLQTLMEEIARGAIAKS
ncbi:glycosyltransferase [Schlesneria sp.]|uniref:glycosyltransferase n=1 Tax=Schlesneria sp. TaxID=2762018 RepID=UPI002EDF6DF5